MYQTRTGTRALGAVIVLAALLSMGAGECGSPPDETTGAAGTGGPAPSCVCPAAPATVAHLPLSCLCAMAQVGPRDGAFLCSRSIADLTADARCYDGRPAYRNAGCSKVSYQPAGGFGDLVFTYYANSGLPIGVYVTNAGAPFGPCAAAGVTDYVYGEGLFPTGHAAAAPADTCASITGCVLCGGSDVPGPRCQ
jgi:hypothetical protein